MTKESLEKAVADATSPEAKTAAEKALNDFTEAAKEGAPLTLDALKIPEDLTVPEEVGKEFLGILNDKALKPAEAAQKLLELQAKVSREASEKGTQAWNDLQNSWQQEASTDAEFGGEKLDPALGVIAKAIDTHSKTPQEAEELRGLFGLTGFGNNIRAIKFLHRLAEAANVAEGRPAVGTSNDPRDGKTQAQVMYPNLPTR